MTRREAIGKAVGKLGMLRYFPEAKATQQGIMELLDSMLDRDESIATRQLRWLVDTVLAHYNDWPGPQELRGVFCTRYAPADGQEAYVAGLMGLGEPLGSLAGEIETASLGDHEERKKLGAGAGLKFLPPGKVM